MIGGLTTAVAFLTRVPLRDRDALTQMSLARAAVWFPVVGLGVGGVAAATRHLAHLELNATAATLIALLVAMLLTGAFHEDGLADWADALGAHAPRERKLEILHDPRVGTYGALAVVFVVALPLAMLAPLDDEHFLRAALVGHVLGRWSTLPLSLAVGRNGGAGLGGMLRVGRLATATGTVIAIAVALAAGGTGPGACALALAGFVTLVGGVVTVRAFGRVTGDGFGAVNKLAELSAYAALAATW